MGVGVTLSFAPVGLGTDDELRCLHPFFGEEAGGTSPFDDGEDAGLETAGAAGEGAGDELELGDEGEPPATKVATLGPGKTYGALASKTLGSKMPGSLSE